MAVRGTCGLFSSRNHPNVGRPSPLVIPNEVRDLQCALRLSQILLGKRRGLEPVHPVYPGKKKSRSTFIFLGRYVGE